MYAEFVHLLELGDLLSDSQLNQVQQLLSYGPSLELPPKQGRRFTTVLPRSTISPWSSKASDIFTRCGLDRVLRVERGVRWFAAEGADLSVIDSEVFDRMTEQVLVRRIFRRLVCASPPKPWPRVPLLREGMAALHEANARLGLALSEDEFEYLQDAYQTLRRDHRRRTDDVCSGQFGALPAQNF